MESDENRKNLIIMIILLVAILISATLSIFYHFFTKDSSSKKKSGSEEIINTDTSIDEEGDVENYPSYNLGDAITLKDSSTWHVIKESDSTDKYVVLLRDNPLDDNISYNDIDNYLQNTYLNTLKNNLETKENISVSLLSLNDIESISEIPNLEIGTSLDTAKNSWIYINQTITSNLSSNDKPIMICTNPNTICEVNSNTYKVRPVIEIDKNILI